MKNDENMSVWIYLAWKWGLFSFFEFFNNLKFKDLYKLKKFSLMGNMIGDLFVTVYWFFTCSFFFIIGLMVLLACFSFLKEKFLNIFGHPLKNTDENVRKAYVMKSNDEELLKNVALTDYSDDVTFQAVERIKNKSFLSEIARNGKFPVSNAAKRKLNEL